MAGQTAARRGPGCSGIWKTSDAEGETASEDLPASTIEGALCTVQLREDEGDSWSIEPLLTLANVSADGFLAALSAALFDDRLAIADLWLVSLVAAGAGPAGRRSAGRPLPFGQR